MLCDVVLKIVWLEEVKGTFRKQVLSSYQGKYSRSVIPLIPCGNGSSTLNPCERTEYQSQLDYPPASNSVIGVHGKRNQRSLWHDPSNHDDNSKTSLTIKALRNNLIQSKAHFSFAFNQCLSWACLIGFDIIRINSFLVHDTASSLWSALDRGFR